MTALDVLEYLASAPAEDVDRIFRLAKRLRADTHKPQAQHEAEAPSAVVLVGSVVEGAQRTVRDMTESVLKDRAQAMHVKELSAAIRERFKAEKTPATIVGSIARMARKQDTFERVGPNIFALLEWNTSRATHEDRPAP